MLSFYRKSSAATPLCLRITHKPPVFTGAYGDDIDAWLKTFEDCARRNNWESADWPLLASLYLSETWRAWLSSRMDTVSADWRMFSRELSRAVGPPNRYELLLEEWHAFCRRPDENAHAHATRFHHALLHRLAETSRPETLNRYLVAIYRKARAVVDDVNSTLGKAVFCALISEDVFRLARCEPATANDDADISMDDGPAARGEVLEPSAYTHKKAKRPMPLMLATSAPIGTLCSSPSSIYSASSVSELSTASSSASPLPATFISSTPIIAPVAEPQRLFSPMAEPYQQIRHLVSPSALFSVQASTQLQSSALPSPHMPDPLLLPPPQHPPPQIPPPPPPPSPPMPQRPLSLQRLFKSPSLLRHRKRQAICASRRVSRLAALTREFDDLSKQFDRLRLRTSGARERSFSTASTHTQDSDKSYVDLESLAMHAPQRETALPRYTPFLPPVALRQRMAPPTSPQLASQNQRSIPSLQMLRFRSRQRQDKAALPPSQPATSHKQTISTRLASICSSCDPRKHKKIICCQPKRTASALFGAIARACRRT
ncbi:hypothetical protein THASP1DRAFT_27083 [Thamnocephalis sphaerospora]|uniref:Retrotransposon gag domain-containing protein n=1 Tax=Thamnocephalis sphaerospora TaxID=78915 RepID=A0A4P9XXP9_9FUNG|nr:hypothetical protein THASP1DRAFT_27083 [Thamnocephalis sphaerospora]|eukprot:RKP11166.1 hypothetical protein THASP1DRAFT_27083 [Thamnocephalis sphaerospora]